MNSKIKTIFLLFLSLFLLSGAAFGAIRFLLVAPGETFTGAGAKTGAPLSQVEGFPFNLMVDSVYDTSWAYVSTLENTNLVASQTAAFNPAVPFLLSENNGLVTTCKRSVTITVDTAATTGTVLFYATPVIVGGTFYNAVSITVQRVSSLQFNAIGVSQVAGTSMPFTITAIKAGGGTADGFTGSSACVTISAVYSPGTTVPVAVATFTNGVATGNITLYDATENAQRVTLTANVTLPAGVPAGLSNNFYVVPAAGPYKLLLIGPGQSIDPGNTYNASGRFGSGSITETAATVTAGTAFSVTVYAVDAYWNTVTAFATGTVTLAAADPLATTPAATALVLGKAILTVKMGTVSAATALTVTSSALYTQDVDIIPVTHGAVDHFDFTSTISNKPAAQVFTYSAVAHDVYNNVVTDFNSAVTFEVLKNSTPLVAGHFVSTLLGIPSFSPSFVNGFISSTYQVKIFEQVPSCSLKLTYNTAVGVSNSFIVSPGAFAKLLVLDPPGEIYNPGAGFPNPDSGKTGAGPNPVTAGASVALTVYGTDAYGNIVTSAGDTFAITSNDAGGLANSITPPVQVTLASGVGSFNFVFAHSGPQEVYCNDITNTNIFPSSETITVQGGTLSFYDFTSLTSPKTTGQYSTPVINARDLYGNPIPSYSGNAWVTSPDTDWSLPDETTIYVSATAGTLYGAAWYVTFTAGTAPLPMYFKRAGSARIFVCDDANGTTSNVTGHRGLSAPVAVNHGASVTKLQVVPPGTTARPGTPDGLDGIPLGHLVADTFTVVVNACDDFWNIVPSIDTIKIITSDNANATAAKSGSPLGPLPVQTGMSAGSVAIDVAYGQEQPNFYIIASDQSNLSVSSFQTPYINIFNVDHFRISGINTQAIQNQVVGVPFTITITAENSSAVRLTSFAGVSIKVWSSNQESDALWTLSPQTSVNFTAGVAIMQVTMYKAGTLATSNQVTINATFGNLPVSSSSSFDLVPAAAAYVITTVPGMNYKPGIVQTGVKGYYAGCIGDPLPVKAGDTFELKVYYTDAWYNRLRSYPVAYDKITCSDPAATLGTAPEMNVTSSDVYVTVTTGFSSDTQNIFKLRTVGASRSQIIYSAPASGSWTQVFPTRPIPIVHADLNNFGISAPGAPQVAGVPFNINIQALDAYGNICDDGVIASAQAFNGSVNLLATSGANTMYPSTYTLVNGQVVASIRLFTAPQDINITASYSTYSGTTAPFPISTISNEFKRLLILDSGTAGMSRSNGRFSGTVPGDDSTFPMAAGAPFANDTSQGVVSYKVGSNHFGMIHQFEVLACDAYGNITATADLAGNTVTITMNDAYGQPVTPTSLDTTNGYNFLDMIFHTAKTQMFVRAHTTQSGIADYTTPTFTTYAGPAYGLQEILPGQIVVEGSAHTTNVGFDQWNNGVANDPLAEPTGASFPVTIQACDLYGNFQGPGANNDNIRVYTAGSAYIFPYPASFPTSAVNFTGNLGDVAPGMLTFTAIYSVSQNLYIQMSFQDLTGTYERPVDNPTIVNVVTGTDFKYELIVNGVKFTDNLDVTATVAPATFNLTVNVVTSLGFPIGQTSQYRLVPVYESDLNAVNGTGIPLVTVPPGGGSGSVTGSYAMLATYAKAERIRIRVDNPNPTTGVQTGPQWSAVIDFGANSLAAVMTASAVPPSIGSGQTSQIRALVVDGGGNSVSGRDVEFDFLSSTLDAQTTGTGTFMQGLTATVHVVATTNAQGIATANFVGGYMNGRCKILVTYHGQGAPQVRTVFVDVSLVDPASLMSNYPNPFMAGSDDPLYGKTNISFYMADAADASLKIYNLFGQLVFEKTYTQAEIAGRIAASGNMITYTWNGKNSRGKIVGNGGYIAVLKSGSVKYTRKIAVRK